MGGIECEMTPFVFNLLGEDVLLFSHTSEPQPYTPATNDSVILLPSLCADFYTAYLPASERPPADHLVAAACSAAHLTLSRGLPLDEILFDTPKGFLKIICTGTGWFEFSVAKCKQLYTNTAILAGCELEYSDVFVGERVRVVRAQRAADFDPSLLARLAVTDSGAATAVVLYGSDGEITVYDGHAGAHTSRLMGAIAASVAELGERGGVAELFNGFSVMLKYGTVIARVALYPSGQNSST